MIIGLGVMMKGQHFFVAPMFVLWPLFMGHWRAPVRWLVGAALAVALVASPWIVSRFTPNVGRTIDWGAVTFVTGSLALTTAGPGRRRLSLEDPAYAAVVLQRIAAAVLWLRRASVVGEGRLGFGTPLGQHDDRDREQPACCFRSLDGRPARGGDRLITIKQLPSNLLLTLRSCFDGRAYRRNDGRPSPSSCRGCLLRPALTNATPWYAAAAGSPSRLLVG